jgi:uncharacterized protein
MIDYRNEFITNKASDKNFNEGLRLYMLKIYNYMAIGLLITGGMAFATLNFEPLVQLMYKLTPAREVYGITGFGIIIQLVPLVIAFSFGFGFANISVANARILFWLYAITMGMSLSSLGFIYTGQSLVRTFLICSSLFGCMSLYGYSTNKDLTSAGSFLIMGLIGLVIISLVNIFLQNSAVNFALSVAGIGIFMGLTAWDTQKLKGMYYYYGGGEVGQKIAIMGAFTLYLDFINLTLYLLNFLGERRKD